MRKNQTGENKCRIVQRMGGIMKNVWFSHRRVLSWGDENHKSQCGKFAH